MSSEPQQSSSESGHASVDASFKAGDRFDAENEPVRDSVTDAGQYISEAISYGKWYLLVQAARIRCAVRNALLMALIGIVAAVIAATILVTATVLLCIGVADAIGALLGGRPWAGDLVTGAVVVGSLVTAIVIFSRRMIRSSGQRTQAEYEKRRARN